MNKLYNRPIRQINVLDYFFNTLSEHAQKSAIVDSQGSWTFEELDRFAQNIAGSLASRAQCINKPIAVYLPKCKEAVGGFLGILYTGNCYAPLDVNLPLARTKQILSRLDPVCVITSSKYKPRLIDCDYSDDFIVLCDDLDSFTSGAIDGWKKCIDLDPVYIIHTSGSTGEPKGVVIPHRAVIDYIDWAQSCFNVNHLDMIGNQAPFVFDNSTLDLYLCFACGCTLNLIPENLFLFPIRLLEYLAEQKVTFIFWVPSLMVNVASAGVLDKVDAICLRMILFAGEIMPTKTLNAWRARFKDALFANLYGPTEITVDCTYYIVDRELKDDEPLPIGKACANTEILILNENNELSKVGEKGELCVRGSSLALGYWDHLEKTEQAFCQNPLNPHYRDILYRTGDIVLVNEMEEILFIGRKDGQIKHMGYRIELGDIEHAVHSVAGIQHGCVFYNQERKEIVLIYESKDDLDIGYIRIEIAKFLPKYMWPTTFHHFSSLPRNPNGKIDRKKLAEEFL